MDVVLRYTPDMPAPPPDTGMLDILSDDPDEGLVTVTLSGQGQEAMMAGEILYADNCAECHGDPFDDVDVGIRKVPGSRECSIVAAIYGNPGAEDEEDSPFPDGVPDMQFLQGALSDEEIMQIADYLNSQPVSGQKRYVTACAGCHGIDASGGFVDEDVRGEDAEETKEAIWDEDAMRFLKCLPHSDIMQIGKYLEMLDDDDDDDHDDDDKDDDDRYAYKDD